MTDCSIWLRVDRQNINFMNRILEAWSHYGALTTFDKKAGLVYIRCTPDTKEFMQHILANLPFAVTAVHEHPA